MAVVARSLLVAAAIGLMILSYQLALQLKFGLLMLMGGVEIGLALLLGLILAVWMARRREWIHPTTGLVWLSLWFPILLMAGQIGFVERRIAQIGPARILADAEQLLRLRRDELLQPEFESAEASRWERIPLRDVRVGRALKELGGLYVEPVGENQLDIRTGGWVDSYEGLMIRPDGTSPDYNSEQVRISQLREIAPGVTWISWDF